MKNQIIALIGCALALSPLGAEETKPKPEVPKGPGRPGVPGGKGDGSFFREMDKNGDKSISKEEAGDRWQGLGKLDKDGDDKVSPQEMMAGRPGGPEGGPGGKGNPGSPGAARGDFFKRADKNGDGNVSKDEVPAEAWERWAKADKNSDGAVSREEMGAAAGGQGGKGGPGGGEMFARTDKNKDGRITKDEAPAEMWERMSKLDKNSDGALTREELAAGMPGRGPGGAGGPGPGGPQGGPGAMFERYDTDKDGKLSKTEVPSEMWDKLSKADDDADGLISKGELEKVYGAREGGPGRPEGRPEGKKREGAEKA